MSACRYLEGENVVPRTAADARKLVGHRIEYLRERDIDRSGRGMFFPRRGVVVAVHGRNIEIENRDWYAIRSFVEVVDLGVAPAAAEG